MYEASCRRCNGKRQRRRRGGLSVQFPHWFMILHSPSGHLCTYTFVLRTTYNTTGSIYYFEVRNIILVLVDTFSCIEID